MVTGIEVENNYWWVGNLFNAFTRWCVPVFIMVSGALLLDPQKQEDLATFYKKRLSRVLIPIVAWTLLYLGWAVLKSAITKEPITAAELGTRVLSGSPHYHMWFLYMIVILYVFTPFFRIIVAHSSRQNLIVLVTICFVLAAINFGYTFAVSAQPRSDLFVNWFLLYLPYFFLGYLIREDSTPRSTIFMGLLFVLSSVLTAAGCYYLSLSHTVKFGQYFYGYLSITVIPMSIGVMYLLKRLNSPLLGASWTRPAANLTLGVYLIHPIILETINHLGYGPNTLQNVFTIPAVATIIFTASLAIAWILRRLPVLRQTV